MKPLRLLFVVQRYGPEVRGGAEQAARNLAERLAARGHLVEVLTTTAQSYVDWSGDLPAGSSEANGVTVHRLPVDPERDPDVFGRLHHRLTDAAAPPSIELQRDWLEAQGPSVPALEPWLDANAGRFDVAAFFTYLYATTTGGLPVAARHTATALVPCAHDEPPLALPAFDRVAHLADSLLFLTPEEAELVLDRFRLRTPHHVVGLGTDTEPARADDPAAVLAAHGLTDVPYLAYVGRIDPSKGTSWLVDQLAAVKAARPSPLKLVLLGEPVVPPPPHPDVIVISDADDATRNAVLAGAVALVHPSPYESFGMVVTEAWALGTPVIAFGGNDVLRGHVERSGGGLCVTTGAELAAAAETLAADPAARRALGRAGRAHVEQRYAWPTVTAAWERALQSTATASHARQPATAPAAPPPPPPAPPAPPAGPEPEAGRRPTSRALASSEVAPAWLVRPVAAALGLLAGACIAGVLAAVAGAFEPAVVVPGALVVGVPLAWAAARALPGWSSPPSVHVTAALVLAFVVATTAYNAVNHGQHLVADRDPGIYLTTAKHLSEAGDLLVQGPTGPFVDADHVSPNGAGFSNAPDDGRLEPQFPHLTATLLAMGAWVTETALFVLTPLIAGAALLCLYLWAATVVNARWAALVTVVTGVSMPFMVFARDTYSEPVAMVLVFGGLLLLHLAHRSGRAPVWLLAGLVLGATSMSRVDGYLYLAPILLAVAVTARLAPPGQRRTTVRNVALCVVGLAVTSLIGWWDTATLTGGYYDDGLAPRLPAMLAAGAFAAAVGWLATPLLWRTPDVSEPARPDAGRGGSETLVATGWLRGMLAGAAVAGVGFFAWAYWIRPDVGDLPAVAEEGMNVLSFLPEASTISLHWLEWYLGPVGLAAGLAGLLWLLLRLGRPGRPDPGVVAGLAAVFVTLLLYIWTPSVTPDHPWAMRRFAPVAMPGLALGAAAVCRSLWGLWQRRRPGSPGSPGNSPRRRAASRLVGAVGVVAAVAVAGATAGTTVAITWPTREARAQIPMRARMDEICDVVDADDAILVPIDGILSLMMSVPVGVWCDVPSAGGRSGLEAVEVAELALAWAEEGRDLVVLSSSATPLANTLLGTGIVSHVTELEPVYPEAIEPTITRRPDEMVVDDRLGKGDDGEVTFYIYEIDLGAAWDLVRASQPDPSPALEGPGA